MRTPYVNEMLDRMDSRLLSEWMAYFDIFPMPDPWLQTGQLASTMANLWSSRRKRFRPEEFMPERKLEGGAKPERQSVRDMMAIMGQFIGRGKR